MLPLHPKEKPRRPKKQRPASFAAVTNDKRPPRRVETVPQSVEGPGGDGSGRKEAAADGGGAVDAAVAAEEEAESAERRRGNGRGRWGMPRTGDGGCGCDG